MIIASDNGFFILRRLGPASAQVTLWLQDKVSILVGQLGDLDKQYSLRDVDDMHNGSFREYEDDQLRQMDEIHSKLIEYSQCILWLNL